MTKRLANPMPREGREKQSEKHGAHLKPLCLDGARQSALAKQNPRRHAFNGVSIALASSPGYKPRSTNG